MFLRHLQLRMDFDLINIQTRTLFATITTIKIRIDYLDGFWSIPHQNNQLVFKPS